MWRQKQWSDPLQEVDQKKLSDYNSNRNNNNTDTFI